MFVIVDFFLKYSNQSDANLFSGKSNPLEERPLNSLSITIVVGLLETDFFGIRHYFCRCSHLWSGFIRRLTVFVCAGGGSVNMKKCTRYVQGTHHITSTHELL